MDGLIAVVDTETTGFSPERHEVIDTHVLLVQPSLEVLFEAGGRSPMLRPEVASPQALEVNGYNAVEWAVTQRPLLQVLPSCLQLIEAAEWWLGMTPDFDVRFIGAACRSVGLEPPRAKKMIDLKDVAKRRGVCGTTDTGKKTYKLDVLCRIYGIAISHEHTARADCYRALYVYRAMGGTL